MEPTTDDFLFFSFQKFEFVEQTNHGPAGLVTGDGNFIFGIIFFSVLFLLFSIAMRYGALNNNWNDREDAYHPDVRFFFFPTIVQLLFFSWGFSERNLGLKWYEVYSYNILEGVLTMIVFIISYYTMKKHFQNKTNSIFTIGVKWT
jgi:hypothetical protein